MPITENVKIPRNPIRNLVKNISVLKEIVSRSFKKGIILTNESYRVAQMNNKKIFIKLELLTTNMRRIEFKIRKKLNG